MCRIARTGAGPHFFTIGILNPGRPPAILSAAFFSNNTIWDWPTCDGFGAYSRSSDYYELAGQHSSGKREADTLASEFE